MPSDLGGLAAREEDVSGPIDKAGSRSYLAGLRLWSLREGERVRATVQVARFAPDADTAGRGFRDQVAAQVGATPPRLRRIGDQEVYVVAADRQTFYCWFRGLHFVLLAIPSDTPDSRALARTVVERVTP